MFQVPTKSLRQNMRRNQQQTPDNNILGTEQTSNEMNGMTQTSNPSVSSAMLMTMPQLFVPLTRAYQGDILSSLQASTIAQIAAQKVAAEALRQAVVSRAQTQLQVSSPAVVANTVSYNNDCLGSSQLNTLSMTSESNEESSPAPECRKNRKRPPSSTDEWEVNLSKVEAALQSKCQPGKKRGELNLPERIELARTRNRKHARIARQRKKERFQELLECETELQQLNKTEELKANRSKSMENFLLLRSMMLTEMVSSLSCCTSTDGGATINPSNNAISSFHQLVDKTLGFSFDLIDFIKGGIATGTNRSPLTQMSDWDRELIERCYSNRPIIEGKNDQFEYKVVGGSDGIALSSNGNGVNRFEIIQSKNDYCADRKEATIIVQGLLEVSFKSNSCGLTSARCTVLSDATQQ